MQNILVYGGLTLRSSCIPRIGEDYDEETLETKNKKKIIKSPEAIQLELSSV